MQIELHALQKSASSKGFGLIAHKASQELQPRKASWLEIMSTSRGNIAHVSHVMPIMLSSLVIRADVCCGIV